MSDDDFDNDEQPREATRPRPKRKKRRPVDATSAVAPRTSAAPHASHPSSASGFTGAHLGGALIAGLIIGGMAGWAVRGGGSQPEAGVAKDSASAVAQNSARPAMTARPQPPPEPTGPVYVALADYSPREGPAHTKVTIVEFSDFQ